MVMTTKRAMATDGDKMGSGYHCPFSSAVAAAAVGKDDKGSVGQFLHGVLAKKNCLCIFSILMFGKEAVCLDSLFCSLHIPRDEFLV
jgi:hypothetical protein